MNRDYTVRVSFLFLLFCAAYSLILLNLYFIQIKHRDFYLQRAQQQHTVTLKKTPPRALITDRTDQLIALNKNSLAAFVLPKKIHDRDALQTFLEQHFPTAAERLKITTDQHFMFVKRRLTPEQVALIEQENLADLYMIEEPNRYYPIESLGQILGITDIDNNGLFGLEQIYNEQLAGTPTTYSIQKDARSGYFYFKKETQVAGYSGSPIKITIDANLQFLSHEALKETVDTFQAQEGSILIMDPETGHILTMAHYPNFDPNNIEKIVQEQTKIKPIAEVYELGSVMKVFVALAALEEGVVTAEEEINCRNVKSTTINGMPVNTWKEHGTIPFCEVIQYSNNIGIALIAQRLGTKLYDYYKLCGFSKKTGLHLPAEQSGTITHPKKWSKQSLISLSFGYEVSATLLQLATAFCTVANGGYLVEPKIIFDQKPQAKEPIFSFETIMTMQDILEKTVTQGTARRAALKGYRVMGKTGTANLIIDGKYNPDHNIYTFAGIVQKDEYKRVIVTFVKEAKKKNLYASQVAVPLFERIMEHVLIHDKVL